MEVWGGIECTINRVGDRQHSQLASSGHLDRIEDDIDAFADLGLTALRYPVLWEHVESAPGRLDFRWADRAMARLRAREIRPIIGLLHHGSGPLRTSLMDPLMPQLFAEYAASVALRYPDVTDWTPVNEPLTTARFSGLYGRWYPHHRDDASFVRMLLLQTRATVLAIRAIRRVIPDARLIQTEDLGRAGGTAPAERQVAFENARRWLSLDLLCGRVTPHHPLYGYLTTRGGANADDLEWFTRNATPPSVIGINHYPRSNRWLDHRLELFASWTHGGNDRMRYADVAAFEMPGVEIPSLASLLDETLQRYGIPLAVTELHVPGDADERLAWWAAGVESARRAVAAGADVRAVTAWSLLGSYDWDTLCTTESGAVSYEAGVFAVSAGERTQTALASGIRRTAAVLGADERVVGTFVQAAAVS